MIIITIALLDCIFGNFNPKELYVGALVVDVAIITAIVCISEFKYKK